MTLIKVASLAFPIAMVYAAWRDVVSYEVPNWVSVFLLAAFAVVAVFAGMAPTTLAWHLAAGGTMLLVGWGLFALGLIGGADAKLLAAAAVWTSWALLAELLLVMALLGGLLALGLILWRRFDLPAGWAGHEWVRRLHARDAGLPYCAAIACAGLWIFPRLPLLAAVPGTAGAGQ